ncbi:class I SAM-dependent methyltransferase [Haladaptatus caseinilyticus]|uniref:class I SAM-dependent methyltransferase n=1 Tax=Haladaptatus caseinilyticus TaxID=2993314 RepID=UPI00224A8DF4|nr:class I SAM-dependent methyltransferase [Haladaptatus caseinilyticus]
MEPNRGDVQATYDRIAAHFAKTREYAWPEVESFLHGRNADTALDLGCGNGRHAELLTSHAERVVGADVSAGLLAEASARARDRNFDVELVQCDAARIPLSANSIDLAVYVATLHHLPTRDARIDSLDELARVLSPDGTALISAWSTAHDKFDQEDAFDTTVDWTLPGGETVPRFYHIYSPEEFREDVAESALVPDDVSISSGNCYAVVRGRKQ